MNWINTAILSAAIMGMVNITDSHLLSRRLPSLRALLLPSGAIHLIYGLILLVCFSFPENADTSPAMGIAIASGIMRAAAALIVLNSLKREEVSQVIPVVYSYPIFVALMAVPLLGEVLSHIQWLAIIIVVAGAMLISAKQQASGSIIWNSKLLPLLAASLLFATADIGAKYALAYISFWNMFCISALCMSVIFLLISLRRHVIKQLFTIKQRNSTIRLLILNETLVPTGIILSFWALQRGPVALVATITSSRPMFVLVFALILSQLSPTFLEWHPTRKILILRLIATAMVIGGIAIIHLT